MNSIKNIPIEDRLIFALDVADNQQAMHLVEELADQVNFYKIGLEIFMAGNYFQLLDWLRVKNKKVFVDLKFFDVPQTVKKAVAQLKNSGASFATIHGNEAIIKAAVSEKQDVKLLAVTVLTSFDDDDFKDLSLSLSAKDMVISRAKRALKIGCDGIVCSGLEASMLREEFGDKFLIVTPGIRAQSNLDDQKRTVDIETAFKNGADYIVVGRPISQARDINKAAADIQKRIAAHFQSI